MYRFLSFQGVHFATSFRRFNSYMRFAYLFLSFHVVHFVTSFLSLQLFFPVRLVLPFLSTRPFPCIRPFVAPFPFHSLLPFVSKLPSRSFASSFRVKWFISFHHSFRFNSYIPCHCRLEKLEWLQVASFLNFNYRAFCNNVTVSNPGLVRLSPWNLRKYGSDGLGAPQYSFHWQQGSPHIPEPTNTASSRFLLVGCIATCNYKLYIYIIFQGSGRLCETSFDNVV